MPSTGPPPLPHDAPADVRAFVAGTADELTLADGPATWVPVPRLLERLAGSHAHPHVRLRPTPRGAAEVHVGWGPAALRLLVEVRAGRLTVTFPGLPNPLLRPLHGDVRRWVEQANGHLAAQGRSLRPLEVGPGTARLRSEAAGP